MGTERRKLIEVPLPLEAINSEAAREKSIPHGHPFTLHLRWACRPPLVVCCSPGSWTMPVSYEDEYGADATSLVCRERPPPNTSEGRW